MGIGEKMTRLPHLKYAVLKEAFDYIRSRTSLNYNLKKDMLFITEKFEEAAAYARQLGVELPGRVYRELGDRYFRKIEANDLLDQINGEAAIRNFLSPVQEVRKPFTRLEDVILQPT